MLYFGKEAIEGMVLVTREPGRLLFSDRFGDLTVGLEAGRPNTVSVTTSHWNRQAQDFLQRLAGPVDGIIHYESQSDEPPQRILERAREYFGQGAEGLGLAISAEQPQRLEFTGGGGQVSVAVRGDRQSAVEVSAREWTYHAEQFVRQVSSER